MAWLCVEIRSWQNRSSNGTYVSFFSIVIALAKVRNIILLFRVHGNVLGWQCSQRKRVGKDYLVRWFLIHLFMKIVSSYENLANAMICFNYALWPCRTFQT